MDRIHSFSCDSFMADRMGLDGTMLHYLAVRKAMVSVHTPVHSKITLTYSLTSLASPTHFLTLPFFCGSRSGLRDYSLTWQTDRCTPRRMAFKALTPRRPFPRLCSSFLCAYCSKKKKTARTGSYLKTATCTRSTTCVRGSPTPCGDITICNVYSLRIARADRRWNWIQTC